MCVCTCVCVCVCVCVYVYVCVSNLCLRANVFVDVFVSRACVLWVGTALLKCSCMSYVRVVHCVCACVYVCLCFLCMCVCVCAHARGRLACAFRWCCALMRCAAAAARADTMENWDQAKLESVVATKGGAQRNRPTDIVCKFFIEAIEKELYGWFWACPNGGDSCQYRHALPPGYVFKSRRQRELEAAMAEEAETEQTLEELIEEQVCVWVGGWVWVWVWDCVFVRVCFCAFVRAHVRTFPAACACYVLVACTRVCVYVCMCVCVCAVGCVRV
jgi:hypothetical protein